MSLAHVAQRPAPSSAPGRRLSLVPRPCVSPRVVRAALVAGLVAGLAVLGMFPQPASANDFVLDDVSTDELGAGGGAMHASIYDVSGFETPHSAAGLGSRRVSGSGMQFRAGHLGFRTFGRDESLSNIELFPYITDGDHMFFGDLRLFLTNRARYGGNAGLGYRQRISDWERIVGASLWYDGDDSTGSYFQQVGVSFESYGEWLDLRSNLYFPIGRTQREFARTLHSQRFVGNQVLFDQDRFLGRAMQGFDYEAGVLVPGDFTRMHDVRVYAGGYHFYGGGVPDINGFRSRIEGDVIPSIRTQVEVTNDRTFGTNVMLGVTWTFSGAYERNWASSRPVDRMGEFVQRNYNVIVSRHRRRDVGLTAVNPATGQAYTVQHVSTVNGNSDGSFENPFQSVHDAQQADSDFIYVHSGSVLEEAVALQPGQILLGEGASHHLVVNDYRVIAMPKATTGTADRPVIRNVAGDAVTLASDSVLSGFIIDSPSGYGIVGTNVADAAVSNIDVLNSGLAGVRLGNLSGPVGFGNLLVNGAGGAGIEVVGGAAAVSFFGNTRVENAAGAGVDIAGNDGTVAFDALDVKAASGQNAVRITGGTGHVGLGDVTLTAQNAAALYVDDAGSVASRRGVIESAGGAAIDLEGAAMQLRLTRLVSEDAAIGLRLVDAPGLLAVNGNGTAGSGGSILNAGTAVVLENVGSLGLQWFDLDQNSTGIQAAGAEYVALVASRVTNTAGQALDFQNVKIVDLIGSAFSQNGAAGQSLINYRATQGGTYTVNLDDSLLVHSAGDVLNIEALSGASGAKLVLTTLGNDFKFSAAGSRAIRTDWNGAIEANITNNNFTGNSGGHTAIDVLNRSTTASTLGLVQNNAMALAGSQSLGGRFTTAAASQLTVRNNLIDLNGANGTGFEFDLAPSASVFVGNNIINDNVAGGTGLLFSSAAGPSQIRIDNNLLDFKGPAGINDRGIVFSNVTGSVQLTSQVNNVVRNASTPFFAPFDTLTGGIWLNNQLIVP